MFSVSVIIPVYNVEKYLRQCVDSILSQNLSNIEILLIDDGSPDNSGAICDEYAKKYNNIKVVHKVNGGLSSARNAGIVEATGDYLMFLDSDDWWNEEVRVQEMFDIVELNPKTEMFLFGMLHHTQEEGFTRRKEQEYLSNVRTDVVKNYYHDLINNGNLEVSAGTKIIRRDFLQKHELYFKEGLLGEDSEWMIRVLRSVTSVKVIDKPLYIYRMDNTGSITHRIKKKNIMDLLSIVDDSMKFYNANQDVNGIRDYEFCFCSYLWFTALGLTYRLTKEEKREVRKFFKDTEEVCRFSNSRKTKLSYFVYRLTGFGCTAFILGAYIQLNLKFSLGKRKGK